MKRMTVVALVLFSVSFCLAQAPQSQPAQPSQPAQGEQMPQPPAPATSQPMPSASSNAAGSAEVLTPDSLKWSSLVPGVQIAVLSGDPNSSGPFSIRLKMVDGNQVAPHWHPTDENLTVISGTFQVGMGDKFEAAALKSLPVGSHAFMPKEMRHYAKALGETVVEVYGEGPFVINYVNPADDPRQKH